MRIILLAAGAFLAATSWAQTPAGVDPLEQIVKLGRGVNVIGYDPIWDDFAKARFKERHFERIHEGGFQTIRVNLQAFSHMDAENRLAPAWLNTLDWVVKNALANDLVVILDEHDFIPCAEDVASCRTRLLAFWEQVAPRYKDTPASVVFEILNEPNGKVDIPGWNSLLKESLAIIRKTNPTRNVVIGPAVWNTFPNLDKLELPPDDRHIIVTVHYYLPMRFTHQGAPWSPENVKLSGIAWGTDAEKRAIQDDFGVVAKWAKANNRPILLGEFGAYEKGDIDSRVRYDAFLARTAEQLGFAWTYWQFDGDFIVYDIDKDEWVKPIWRALAPAAEPPAREKATPPAS